MMCSTCVLLHDKQLISTYVIKFCCYVLCQQMATCVVMCYIKMYHIVTSHPITCPHIFVLHRLWNIIISVSHLSENHVTQLTNNEDGIPSGPAAELVESSCIASIIFFFFR